MDAIVGSRLERVLGGLGLLIEALCGEVLRV